MLKIFTFFKDALLFPILLPIAFFVVACYPDEFGVGPGVLD